MVTASKNSDERDQDISFKKLKILGADLLAGSPESKKKPRYAAFLVNGENTLSFDEIDLDKLNRLIRAEKPDYLAVDNIFELFNKKELIFFSRRLPVTTSLVQVTGSPQHGFVTVKQLAKQYGLAKDTGKLKALETAEICARLVLMNQGFRVSALEDEATILFTRKRSKGPGGWSQQRFSRRMDISVSNASKSFLEKLDELDIEYDEFLYKERTIVKIPVSNSTTITEIRKLALKFKTDEVNVKVFQEPKKLEFIPLSAKVPSLVGKKLKSLIVGIDPGTTVGLAILNLNGKIEGLFSRRNLSTMAGVKLIASFGKPAIIAADVSPVPKTVQKYKKTFNCRLETPGRKASKQEKKKLISEEIENLDIRVDAHARDALYAALHAYKKHVSLFKKIKEEFYNNTLLRNYSGMLDNVYEEVLAGKSIHSALEGQLKRIELLLQLQVPDLEEHQEKYPVQAQQEITSLMKRKEKLQLENSLLQNSLDRIQEEHARLQKDFEHLFEEYNGFRAKRSLRAEKDKKVRERTDRIQSLKKEINKLRNAISGLELRLDAATKFRNFWSRGDIIPLRVIVKFSEEAIIQFDREVGLSPDDLVLFKDPSGGGSKTANLLAERGVVAVLLEEGQKITQGASESLREQKIGCFALQVFRFDPENLVQELPTEKTRAFIIKFEDFYCINKKKMQVMLKKFQYELERELAEKRKKQLGIERDTTDEDEEDPIINMISEYQKARSLALKIYPDLEEDEEEKEEGVGIRLEEDE
ncbi:MAG: DUF460 domain-containing protein [Candidatus Hodarchaeales archaeon]